MQNEVRVGDAVAWAQVPNRSMVRWWWDGFGFEYHYRRHEHVTSRVGSHDGQWRRQGRDDGTFASQERVVIIALDLTGQETAADLQRLAEVYEIREHLISTGDDSIWFGEEIDELAPRLQAVGWKPGMTAEDAARLLK